MLDDMNAFELANDLPPSTDMTEEEKEAEISKINATPNHPYWDGSHIDHKRWVIRMTDLFKGVQTQTPLEKIFKSPDEIRDIAAKGFAEIAVEKARRDWDKVSNDFALAQRDPGPPEHFEEVLERAHGIIQDLVHLKMIDPKFMDFLDEAEDESGSPLGNSASIIKLFSDLRKLQAKFTEWQKIKDGKEGE
jgi:hypothetical protein